MLGGEWRVGASRGSVEDAAVTIGRVRAAVRKPLAQKRTRAAKRKSQSRTAETRGRKAERQSRKAETRGRRAETRGRRAVGVARKAEGRDRKAETVAAGATEEQRFAGGGGSALRPEAGRFAAWSPAPAPLVTWWALSTWWCDPS